MKKERSRFVDGHWTRTLSLALAVAALSAAAAQARAGEPADEKAGAVRPRGTPSAVQAVAQGGGGVTPVPGAPPPPESSIGIRPSRATAQPRSPRSGSSEAGGTALKALSIEEGEATVEVSGERKVVRVGSRVGTDVVKAVGPGRIVIERPDPSGQGRPTLVIMTFDEAGRARTRIFRPIDSTAPFAPEVEQP